MNFYFLTNALGIAPYVDTEQHPFEKLKSDIVANPIEWPERCGPRWQLYPKCTVVSRKCWPKVATISEVYCTAC